MPRRGGVLLVLWTAHGHHARCTGNAARAIYYVWASISPHENGKLRVNLLLNWASPWADMDGHILCTGQEDVKVGQPLEPFLFHPSSFGSTTASRATVKTRSPSLTFASPKPWQTPTRRLSVISLPSRVRTANIPPSGYSTPSWRLA